MRKWQKWWFYMVAYRVWYSARADLLKIHGFHTYIHFQVYRRWCFHPMPSRVIHSNIHKCYTNNVSWCSTIIYQSVSCEGRRVPIIIEGRTTVVRAGYSLVTEHSLRCSTAESTILVVPLPCLHTHIIICHDTLFFVFICVSEIYRSLSREGRLNHNYHFPIIAFNVCETELKICMWRVLHEVYHVSYVCLFVTVQHYIDIHTFLVSAAFYFLPLSCRSDLWVLWREDRNVLCVARALYHCSHCACCGGVYFLGKTIIYPLFYVHATNSIIIYQTSN
jgi:hypothetical protein